MQAEQFIKKWSASKLGEDKHGRGSVLHFLDLCELLGVPKPSDADLEGNRYCFEKGVSQTTGARGWADVWKQGCFAWEYKGKGKDLDKAFEQLLRYAAALENPPLLIVSDMERIIIHTNWTNTVSEKYEFTLADLTQLAVREKLRCCFENPDKLKPSKTTKAVTEKAAGEFAKLAERLHKRKEDPEKVAHFVNRLAFCMFAEDANLLPHEFFTDRLYKLVTHPDRAAATLKGFFNAMSRGGQYGDDVIPYFNGGLFDNDDVLHLEPEDLALLHKIAKDNDWQDIDPSIFGTLFERGLDPAKRSQLGAHYTDAEKIEMIIGPVVREPLLREWEAAKAKIEGAKGAKARQQAHGAYIERLKAYRVLDPACGSGNFLYLALKTLKDIEHRVHLESEALGMQPPLFMVTGPHNMLGIELNSYAAELARMTVWIGEIQWCMKHGQQIDQNPILKTLRTIENRDALLNDDGTETQWPAADAIVGNPPFLGDKKMKKELGAKETALIRKAFKGQLKGRSDLVCYWFAKSNSLLKKKKTSRVGLVSTNSIRQASNRGVLESIRETGEIFKAWSDEAWTVEGAAVRVSIVCFGQKGLEPEKILNDKPIEEIYPDLTGKKSGAVGLNLSEAKKLKSNLNSAFQGIKRVGEFEVTGTQARAWLKLPQNPNGKKNSEVLKPWYSGHDIVKRPRDYWIVDYGWNTPFNEACLFEAPFKHVEEKVKPKRVGKREKRANESWWIYYWPRPEMRQSLMKVKRYLTSPSVAKHRFFSWVDSRIIPDGALVVIAKEDDVSFGLLHSKIHILWSSKCGSTLEDRPAYTPSTSFETFPFPKGLEPNRKATDYDNPHAAKIAEAAKLLNEQRENWLNPSDLVKRVPEVVTGYPDRLEPVNAAAAETLKERTLTKLYNKKPAWLQQAHADLDAAVAAAYGWPADLSNDEILAKLLEMNLKGDK